MNNRSEQVYDELLVLRCQDGDSAAMEKLIKRWQRPLLSYASVITNEPDIAKEAVQEAWISAIKGLQRLHDPSRFRHWLFRIVHNKCIDAMRSASSRPRGDNQEEVTTAQMDDIENRDEVAKVLASLSEHHRAVLALFYLQDMDVKDIAGLLDLAEGTVKSRLFNAREAFRKVLEEKVGGSHERSGQEDRTSA